MEKAFTLIELLIVVAIIGLLAAIAIPNFLSAQIRAKASRVKADHRTIATALEMYSVDNNLYPPEGNSNKNPVSVAYGHQSLIRLTTPIKYLSSLKSLADPFIGKRTEYAEGGWYSVGKWAYDYADYSTWADIRINELDHDPLYFRGWGLMSTGPDCVHQGGLWGPYLLRLDPVSKLDNVLGTIYDPTNGTVSRGEIVTIGGQVPPKAAEIYK